MDKRLKNVLRTAGLCAMDCLFLLAGYAASIVLFTYLRKIPGGFLEPYQSSIPYMIVGCVAAFFLLGVYRDMWGYISLLDMLRLAVASGIAAFVGYLAMRFTWGVWPSPIIGVTAFYIFFTMTAGVRLLPSLLSTARKVVGWRSLGKDNRVPLLVVGAGEAAAALIKDMQNQGKECPYRIVGAVDDNSGKHGRALRGVPVLGGSQDIPTLAKRLSVQEIVIAIPSATTEQRRALISLCAPTGCKLRAMSAVSDAADAKVTKLHNLDVGDLLGRKEVVLDPKLMATYLTGRTVLVTGGGGSIGSELCRQIMRFDPQSMVIFDFYENNAYDLVRELRLVYHDRADDIVVRIGSVQDRARLQAVFDEVRPDVVFHAAAYKHVSLMEQCPELAIQNNVFGTYNTAQCAMNSGVRRFVMISTDKAVNPTNVMGASKRLAELVIQSMNGQGTEFVAVRFGNVLGSNGSVVPLFHRQIEAGGPVTITHPDIIRYFMTIPEAARLVLQAGARARGGETFVLDMGEPVKIIDLARSMIRMAGLEPETDIPIKVIGLLPGEKLYEELLLAAEGAEKTEDEKIYIAHSTVLTNAQRRDILDRLHQVIAQGGDVKACIKDLLPTYRPQEQ